mmetsp:Transcript_39807/g.80307  ORF Transcript_39807/g.80307 Transcript_39807/m.80307 type:complete len:142 (+) Transcript_39807:131-556(+)
MGRTHEGPLFWTASKLAATPDLVRAWVRGWHWERGVRSTEPLSLFGFPGARCPVLKKGLSLGGFHGFSELTPKDHWVAAKDQPQCRVLVALEQARRALVEEVREKREGTAMQKTAMLSEAEMMILVGCVEVAAAASLAVHF